MTDTNTAAKRGLEGVAAADSSICRIDGEKGELRYRGYLAGDLAEHSTFAETAFLLLEGELPNAEQLRAFEAELAGARTIEPLVMDLLRTLAPAQAPMDCLRTLVSAMSAVDVPQNDDGLDVHRRRGVRLIAALPTVLAAYDRVRRGLAPVVPDPQATLAGDFLRMLNDQRADPEVERMLDVCLVLHAEHGFNASTFSARVTAATMSDVYSSITSAIGTLKGPLHGGANTAVMNMLLEIGEPERAESHIDALIGRHQKVMGFGHRVYKVVDPRALILRAFSERMAKSSGESKWFEISRGVERAMHEKKGLDMNVDFYSASVYYQMGIAPDLFTGIFAMSRMAGWVAHVLEQLADNRLIRPRANYVGPGPREWVPVDRRG